MTTTEAPKEKIKIILAEPKTLTRRGLEQLLQAKDIRLIHSVGTAKELKAFLETADLDIGIVLLSATLAFPKEPTQGQDLISHIRSHAAGLRVVLLGSPDTTGASEEEEILKAFRNGVAAYITNDREPEQMLEDLRTVAVNKFIVEEFVFKRAGLAQRIIQDFFRFDHAPEGVQYSPLSPRETQILDLISKGRTNKEVGRELSISDQTVKNHMSSIMRKLSVNDRTHAVVTALTNGWLEPAQQKRAAEETQ